MTVQRLLLAGCCLLVAALAAPSAHAQRSGQMPAQLEGTGIDEQLGARIPTDLVFHDESGARVELERYFDGDRPVLLALIYHDCPMLCNMVMHGLTSTMARMDWLPGQQFQLLAVSFNPRETPERALEEKRMYLEMLGKPGADAGMHFLTGDSAAITALTASVGFTYRWVEAEQQYAHPSGLIFLSGDGKISRYIYGVEYQPRDVRKALVEASDGKVGSTVDQVILYCFQYDPNSNSYVPHALNLMKLGGVLTVLVLGSFLLVYWRREGRRSNEQAAA